MFKSSPKKIFVSVRADAGPDIGYGHIKRTMTILKALKSKCEIEVLFLTEKGCDCCIIERNDYQYKILEENKIAEITQFFPPEKGPLILDSYQVSEKDLIFLKENNYFILVFDDGKRLNKYYADLVVDSAPGAEKIGYIGLNNTVFCLGPDFFPLRDEFLDVARKNPGSSGKIQNVIITMGGSDSDDVTVKILNMLLKQKNEINFKVILGPGYQGKAEKLDLPPDRFHFLKNVENMAEIMCEADLAISASGGTALELAYLGLPALLIILSEDQLNIANMLHKNNAAINLGWFDKINSGNLLKHLDNFRANRKLYSNAIKNGKKIIDGQGSVRIAELLMSGWQKVRNLTNN